MTLDEAIKVFKKEHRFLQDPKEADGRCEDMSNAFLAFLKKNQVPHTSTAKVVTYGPGAGTGRHHPLKPQLAPLKCWVVLDGRRRATGRCVYHAVVGIRKLRIDWTARQFDRRSPFPLIWSVK